jgi:hypothetical protein
MSLIDFHRVLILAAIAFCFGFAGWELNEYMRAGGGSGAIAVAAVFTVLGVALAVYLVRLRSILRLRDPR